MGIVGAENGLLIKIPKVEKKDYLDYLKRKAGFLRYAREQNLLNQNHQGIKRRIDDLFL
ncbi:hypothetical protein J4422_02510 [Candidatus Pacearchaeota archaeon]|nr:hypothetical protein [Candidatus Pacearchaeota archaeon]